MSIDDIVFAVIFNTCIQRFLLLLFTNAKQSSAFDLGSNCVTFLSVLKAFWTRIG